MSLSEEIVQALVDLSRPDKAEFLPRFFKTGKGEYAEGDLFLGVVVPDSRKVAKHYSHLVGFEDLEVLIKSGFHEVRLVALLIMISQFEKAKHDRNFQSEIVNFYLNHTKFINNWDLVDVSCYKLLGRFCYEANRPEILRKLSFSNLMWEKRMAVVSTMFYIKKSSFDLTKEFVVRNLNHPHDLIHKANGWLLREMGKKDETELMRFLNVYYQKMPRTSLRYAIERLDEDTRQDFLKSRI